MYHFSIICVLNINQNFAQTYSSSSFRDFNEKLLEAYRPKLKNFPGRCWLVNCMGKMVILLNHIYNMIVMGASYLNFGYLQHLIALVKGIHMANGKEKHMNGSMVFINVHVLKLISK